MQKKCKKLEKKKKLEQEVVTLGGHIEMDMAEHSQVEQYKRETEERARQGLVEKLKEGNLFLQVNLSICHVLEFTFTAHYILDPYSLCVSSASLRAGSFVDFWKEGGTCFPFKYFSFHHSYH